MCRTGTKKELLNEGVLFLLDNLVHCRSGFFGAVLRQRQDPCLDLGVAELDQDNIARLDFASWLCSLSIDQDPVLLAGLLGNGPSLYQS